MAYRYIRKWLPIIVLGLLSGSLAVASPAQALDTAEQKIETALDNVAVLVRPGFDGYATFWDGNKYVQCRRTAEQTFRCEAAGVLMQPR